MNILHIIPSINPKLGGPAEGIRNYESGLKEFDHIHRTIICFDDPEEATTWITGKLKVIGLGKVSNNLQYHRKLKGWLREFVRDYDVVIINGLWLYHSYATMSVINEIKLKGMKVPKVFLFPHGMLDPWFQKVKHRRLKAFRNILYWHLIEKNVVNSVDGLLFTCQEELELARSTFKGYHPKSEINVGYGVAAPPTYNNRMKLAFLDHYPVIKNKLYFLFLSRIHPKKGVDLLLKAYLKLRESTKTNFISDIPDLVIAGPGMDSKYGREILKLISKNTELINHVHVLGMLTGDSKWGALNGCEGFILPSHQENFGIAVVEALACKKPVLISNQVNIWKEINVCKSGLIEDDTVEGTYKLLSTFMLLSAIERDKMQKQALYTFNIFFNIKEAAKKFIDVISM